MYENRCCNQDDFSILVCGGKDKNKRVVNSVYKLNGPDLKCKTFTSMPNELYGCKTAVIGSDVFVYGGESKIDWTNEEVVHFCNKTKAWSYKAEIWLGSYDFCFCSFMKNLYLMSSTGRCFVYNFKNKRWIENAKRSDGFGASCAVFEGKIVVTVGRRKSVEAYDYYENKWNKLPDMIERRKDHTSVGFGNKLFVIGGYHLSHFEVFDSFSRKFTIFNSFVENSLKAYDFKKAVCVGNKIFVFTDQGEYRLFGTNVFIYDVINGNWSEKKVPIVNSLSLSSFIKYKLD